jgi:hypothetical protein
MATTEPNLFQFAGRHLHVGYSSTGIDGKPVLNYDDGTTGTSFSGDEIRVSN